MKSATSIAISNLESMWSQVDAIRIKVIGECLHARPENSFTLSEYCQRFKVMRSTAKGQLSNLVLRGEIQVVKVLLPNSAGSFVMHNVYIPVPVAK